VEAREGKVMLLRGSDYLQEADRFPRLKSSTPDAQLDEVIRIVRAARR
jgi:bifunctional pyridoxal-dependent enzyme with beta-cystathionase and maltose regulon repressor activities